MIINPNNYGILSGRISNIREYSEGKAANVTIALNNNGKKADTIYIQTKCFSPEAYGNAAIGMMVDIYTHLQPNNYTDANGTKHYSTDIVADTIIYRESKQVVEARNMAKE